MTPDELDAIEARHHLFCAAPWCGTPLVERRQWCALARTIAALREAEAAIARVRARHIHQPPIHGYYDKTGFCRHCHTDWPCDTIRDLDEEEKS